VRHERAVLLLDVRRFERREARAAAANAARLSRIPSPEMRSVTSSPSSAASHSVRDAGPARRIAQRPGQRLPMSTASALVVACVV
jgi:hypothetical protein